MALMALTFDCVLVAAEREPPGFAAFSRHSPDGLRRSVNNVSAIGRSPLRGLNISSTSTAGWRERLRPYRLELRWRGWQRMLVIRPGFRELH